MPARVTLGSPSPLQDKQDIVKDVDMPQEQQSTKRTSAPAPTTAVGSDFVQMYQKYKERIYNYIYMLVKNDELAQDLTADAFLKLFKKWSELQEHQNILAWLYLVSKNSVIDHYRSAHNKQTITFAELNLRQQDGDGHLIEEQLADDSYETMLADVLHDEQMGYVRGVLETLSLDDQTVLYMRYYEELPIADLAVIYNKTEDAMKMYLHRLVKKIQKLAEKSSPESDTTTQTEDETE